MEANAFLVETVAPIVKWALMFVPMLKKGRISFVHRVLVAGYALRYVQEGC